MCGRFALGTPIEDILDELEGEMLSDVVPFTPSWNVAPSTLLPIITSAGTNPTVECRWNVHSMRWGFRPSWSSGAGREPINARSETMHEKPMFRDAAASRWGVVPADGWYEWMTTPQGKVPWFHRRTDDAVSLLAVIWDETATEGPTAKSCALLTQASNEDCQPVHHRMPVVVEPRFLKSWLNEGQLPPPPTTGTIQCHPVSRRVNRVEEDHPGLVEPLVTLFDHE